jgi:hypothetical protein
MSDGAVSSLISEMENYLKETELPDLDYIVEWNDKFHAAVDIADRGPGWEEVVTRAHTLGEVIQKRIGGLNYERDQLRRELQIQSVGKRALKGYSSGIQ